MYYKVDTLLDAFTLLPQRGSVYSEEGKRHRFKTTQFDRAAKKVNFEYRADTTVKADFSTSTTTQDALSAIYVLRASALKAGDKLTMPVSDNGSNYKVQFEAAGLERVRAPIGERSALKVRLSIFDDKNQSRRQEHRDLAVRRSASSAGEAHRRFACWQLQSAAAGSEVTLRQGQREAGVLIDPLIDAGKAGPVEHFDNLLRPVLV